MSHLYFNEESDYSEKNASDSEDFRSTIFEPSLNHHHYISMV